MENKIIKSVVKKAGYDDLIEILTEKLSLSELNSLLLEVYRIRSQKITPTQLLNAYESNRFVKPADENPLEVLKLQQMILEIAISLCFTPIDLSPVAPLGACSAIAPVNQNKVISALRGTEVIADATNSLALHICSIKKRSTSLINKRYRYCAFHRHIRGQKYKSARSKTHFNLFCMVTSGRDLGSYSFEKESLLEHLMVYKTIFEKLGYTSKIKLKLMQRGGYTDPDGFLERLTHYIGQSLDLDIDVIDNSSGIINEYYKGLQFKIFVQINGNEYEAADGGFVDWSQKLLGNKKERMLISGLGVNLLLSMIKH